MKLRDHINIIEEQIEAMRKDKHDRNSLVSIQLDAIEYGCGAIIEASYKKPGPFMPENNT